MFLAVDEFFKSSSLTPEGNFGSELDLFLASSDCQQSIVFVISSCDTTATKKLSDNQYIDDFLSPIFDNIEFFNAVS